MKLQTLLLTLCQCSFSIFDDENDKLLASGELYFYGNGRHCVFDECYSTRNELCKYSVTSIYPGRANHVNIYVTVA